MKYFRSLKSKWLKISFVIIATVGVVFSFQNCGNVNLNALSSTGTFASTGFPMQMRAPTQYPIFKRYVMLVDMSNSMVSGPCPFDVDVDPTVHGQSGPYYDLDPNPSKTDPNAKLADQRGQARDCTVDPTLAPPMQSSMIQHVSSTASWNTIFHHKTFTGADPLALRVGVVKDWIQQLRQNLPPAAAQRVELLIWPINGGNAMKSMIQGSTLKNKFVNLFDPNIDKVLKDLSDINSYEKRLREMPVEFRWAEPNFLDPSKPLGLDTKMGTTSVGEILTDIYTPMNENFRNLTLTGDISSANFEIMLFGDGHITPLNEHFDRVMSMWHGCNCTGAMCTVTSCLELWTSLKEAWGDPDANKIEAVDFKLSLLQSLPRFYGGGFLDVNFLKLGADRYDLAFPNSKSMFQNLTEMSQARDVHIKNWKVTTAQAPFALASASSQITTFKMTHLFIMNPNVRMGVDSKLKVDSDGDGLPDDEETAAGTDLTNQRTFGYCLDSLYVHSIYGPKCKALEATKGCNPELDSDGDSLNECDEMVLGTDPYDFDTDGDGIPDSLEWIYGFNPLRSDTNLDTNADGLVNIINFAAGVPPQVDPREVPAFLKTDYQVNMLDPAIIKDPELGSVRVDQFDVRINSIPNHRLTPVSPASQKPLYIARLSTGMNAAKLLIPTTHRLLKSTADLTNNVLFGLLRTVDPDQPERVFWQILEIPFSITQLNTNQQLDISRFEQIRVMDRHGVGK